jgi:hypothetical protein
VLSLTRMPRPHKPVQLFCPTLLDVVPKFELYGDRLFGRFCARTLPVTAGIHAPIIPPKWLGQSGGFRLSIMPRALSVAMQLSSLALRARLAMVARLLKSKQRSRSSHATATSLRASSNTTRTYRSNAAATSEELGWEQARF